MKTIDVYKQYFCAECTFNGVERRGAAVWLTAESDSGMRRELTEYVFSDRNSVPEVPRGTLHLGEADDILDL